MGIDIIEEEQDICKQFAVFIKEKRLTLGMSQEEFAVYVFKDKTKRPWISRIENNNRQVNMQTFGKIMKALNCEVEFIEH